MKVRKKKSICNRMSINLHQIHRVVTRITKLIHWLRRELGPLAALCNSIGTISDSSCVRPEKPQSFAFC